MSGDDARQPRWWQAEWWRQRFTAGSRQQGSDVPQQQVSEASEQVSEDSVDHLVNMLAVTVLARENVESEQRYLTDMEEQLKELVRRGGHLPFAVEAEYRRRVFRYIGDNDLLLALARLVWELGGQSPSQGRYHVIPVDSLDESQAADAAEPLLASAVERQQEVGAEAMCRVAPDGGSQELPEVESEQMRLLIASELESSRRRFYSLISFALGELGRGAAALRRANHKLRRLTAPATPPAFQVSPVTTAPPRSVSTLRNSFRRLFTKGGVA